MSLSAQLRALLHYPATGPNDYLALALAAVNSEVRAARSAVQTDRWDEPMTAPKQRILFLCTGNSCRSQMAQGWANFLGGNQVEARSAGIEAHGKNPRAIAVMCEAGVDISQQESTRLTPTMLAWAELVVTVCGHADEHCPVLPAGTCKRHWPLADPAKATGTEAEVMTVFRATRDQLRVQVSQLLTELHVPHRTHAK